MVPDVLHILTVPYILYHSLLDYDTIYLLTATGLIPGGVEQCTFTHKNNTQDNTITNWEECGPWAMSRLCELYPGICLTTEEKARKNFSQGRKTSVRVGKTSVRVGKTSVWVVKTSVRVGKTSVQVVKTSVRVGKTSVQVVKTSVRVGKTSVRVGKPSVRLGNTSVRVRTTSVRLKQ